MKLILILSAALLPFVAEAQGDGIVTRAGALWLNSGNAAGIVTDSLARYNTADISYSYEAGSLHLCQTGDRESIVNFNTQGTADVGRFRLWGSFAYTNTSPQGCTFNTLLYNPSDERYLYNVTDTVSSSWRKQAYDLRMKAAYDLSKAFKLGLELQYSDRIAAKQNDPRSETYDYNITVIPSAIFTSGIFSCGLNALYTNSFIRSTPTLSNNQEYQNVYISKGLGNYLPEIVGGSSLSTLSYKGNSYGGGAQIAFNTAFSFIADFSYIAHITELSENPTMPKPIGRTNVTDISLQTRSVWGNRFRHIVCAGFTSRKTTGTEYAAKQVTGKGWVIQTQTAMSNLGTMDINLGYDGFIMPEGKEHNWHFGAYLDYISKDDAYIYPVSTYNYRTLAAKLAADRRFFFKKNSLYAGLSFEFSKSLGGEYSYGGKLSGNPLAGSWLPQDNYIMTRDVAGGSVDLSYRIRLGVGVSLDIKASGFLRTAFSPCNRYGFNAGIGLVF